MGLATLPRRGKPTPLHGLVLVSLVLNIALGACLGTEAPTVSTTSASSTSQATTPNAIPSLAQSSTGGTCSSAGPPRPSEAVLDGTASVLQVVPTITFSEVGDCDRLAVDLGHEDGDLIPEIRVFQRGDGEVRVQLPAIAATQPLEEGAAVDGTSHGISAFVVAETGSSAVRIFPDRELSLSVWWSSIDNVLVLDMRIDLSSSHHSVPIVGVDGVNVVLTSPVGSDVQDSELPIEVVGFSRLIFEGQGVVRIRRDVNKQAGGELVPVELSGPGIGSFPGTNLEHGLALSASDGAWTEFQFAIESLDPGRYELFVGDDVALGDSDVHEEVGVYVNFAVSG